MDATPPQIEPARGEYGPLAPLRRLLAGGGGRAGRMRRSGHLAGLFFLAGGITAIPALMLIAPGSDVVFWLPALGLVPAVAFFFIPWERLPDWVLHIPPAAGAAIVCLSVLEVGLQPTIYYVFVAVFVAVTFRRIPTIVAHLALISVALLLPVFVGPESGREALAIAVVTLPTLILVAGVIAYQTRRIEASRAELFALSRRDELTGVGNYRALHERLAEEISRHRRHERKFALLLVDLDGFKEVNERLGHLEGDRVLAGVGAALREGIRGGDSVFRQGGDEFSVIAPETDAGETEELAGRLRVRIAGANPGDLRVTAETGWAVFPDDAQTAGDLLGFADMRLLAAKRRARAERDAGERDPDQS